MKSKEGSGLIFSNMRDAVILTCRDKNINYRTSENDNLVIAAADEVYNKEKGNANKTMDIRLVFQPAGETEQPSVTVKTYHLTASE